jgi:hypothetical protein
MSAVGSRIESAHRQAVETSPKDIAKFLSETLGKALVAHIAGVTPKTVDRWIGGDDRPRSASELRLRTAFQVFHLLQSRDSPHTVRAWFIGLNPQLDDKSPAQALRDGELRDVVTAAKSFLLGG